MIRKRFIRVFPLTGSFVVFLAAGILTAASVTDVIKIDNKGYQQDRRGPVNLSHKKHAEDYKVACNQCHHEYKDGKNVWKDTDPVKKCIECHDPVEKKGNADTLQNAYHKNCQGCHKELQGKEAPYKKCTDCHERKS